MLGSQSTTNLVYVQGKAGAKAYPIMNGYTMMLMDSEDTKFYIKQTDAVGIPKLREFKFEEVVEPEPEKKEFITKEDFESFRSEIKQLLSSVPKQKTVKAGEDNA